MIYIIYIYGVILPPSLNTPERISFLSPLLSSFSHTHTHSVVASRVASLLMPQVIYTYLHACVCVRYREKRTAQLRSFFLRRTSERKEGTFTTHTHTHTHACTRTHMCVSSEEPGRGETKMENDLEKRGRGAGQGGWGVVDPACGSTIPLPSFLSFSAIYLSI